MQDTPRVAIVDNDRKLREAVCQVLEHAGFAVVEAASGAELRQSLSRNGIDLIVLETALPGEDGLAVARFVRAKHPDVAVLLVSAAAEAIDRIVGLEIGADDYLAKPFDLRELTARIKSILRRAGRRGGSASAAHRAVFGRCVLDLETRRLRDERGDEIPLGKLEFALLKTFAEHPRRLLSRDDLLDLAHDGDRDPYDRSIDIRIGRIRRKIEHDPAHPKAIRTVRGAGYIYMPEE